MGSANDHRAPHTLLHRLPVDERMNHQRLQVAELRVQGPQEDNANGLRGLRIHRPRYRHFLEVDLGQKKEARSAF